MMTIFNHTKASTNADTQKEILIDKIHCLLEKVEGADSVEDMRHLAEDTRQLTSLLFNWKPSTPANWFSILSKLPK